MDSFTNRPAGAGSEPACLSRDEISNALNAAPAAALAYIMPEGYLDGREFRCGDVFGKAPSRKGGGSFHFNIDKLTGGDFSPNSVAVKDTFGSVFDVYVIHHHGNFKAARETALKFLGISEEDRKQPRQENGRSSKASSDTWTQIFPAPAIPPNFKSLVWEGYQLSGVWPYKAADGKALFYVLRMDKEEIDPETGEIVTNKATPVVSYGHFADGRRHWRTKGNGKNILFGLDELAKRPAAPVLIVEGEKTATAARLMFPDWVVVCWKGGCGNVGKIDFSPLRDRVVYSLADADDAGVAAMKIAQKAAAAAGAINPSMSIPPKACWEAKKGWDLADEFPAGLTVEGIRAHILSGEPPPDKFERCDPSFTAPKTTAAEAFAELRSAFEPAWHNAIVPAVQQYRNWSAEVAAADEEGVTPPDQPLMPQIGMAPGMGIGKTELIVQAAKSSKGVRTGIFVPSHALAGDVERRINELESEGAGVWSGMERPDPNKPGCSMCWRLASVKLMMACGGSSTDLCGTKKKGFCPHNPHHPESGNPGFEVCGTQRQNMDMSVDQNRVVVMPHAMLGNPPPAALRRSAVEVPFAGRTVTVDRPAFDVIAIDEAPWLSMVKVRSARVDLSDLNRSYVDEWKVPARPGEDQNFAGRRLREISVRTYDVLAENYDKTAFTRLTKAMFANAASPLTGDMCDEAHKLTWRLNIDPVQHIRPDMTDDEVSHALSPIIKHNRVVRRMARFWKSLSEFLTGSEDVSPYLTLAPRAEKDADEHQDDADDAEAQQENVPTGNTVPTIALSWRLDIHPDWLKGPVVFADGTMNETLTRYWLPSINVISRARASTPQAVRRRQVIDRPVSHHMVCPKNTGRIDKNEKTRRNHAADLALLLELRASQYRGKGRSIAENNGSRTRIDVGFIVPKSLEDYWMENGMIPATPAVEVHHSGNVRGMTRLEVAAHLTIVSRTLTAPAATEELAWVISGHVGQEVPKGEWYPTRDAGVLMRDGTGRKVKQVYHPDPIAEAVRWQICEANVLQDEARGRAARRDDSRPLTIDILTDVALPLELDEVVNYADVMAEVDPASMSLARGLIAFDWHGVGMVCRDMFRSVKDIASAAKMWGSRNADRRTVLDHVRSEIKGTPPVTNSFNIDSSLKEFVTPPLSGYRICRYRAAGTATVREMAISRDHANPREALEKVAGPLEFFEAAVQAEDLDVVEIDPAAFEPDEPALAAAAAAGHGVDLDTVEGLQEAIKWMRALDMAGVLTSEQAEALGAARNSAKFPDVILAEESRRRLDSPALSW